MLQKAKDLISKMTLQEKVSQMMNEAAGIERLGIKPYDWWSEALHGVARNGRATMFPEPIGLGATFDPELIHEIGEAISWEARAKYIASQRIQNYNRYAGLTFWSPNVNIFRDPRWGRGMETYGEDPFLTGTLGTAFVKGLQGDDPFYLRVGACGLVGATIWQIIALILAISILVVLGGLYTGMHFGFEKKTIAYILGAVLLWGAGAEIFLSRVIDFV